MKTRFILIIFGLLFVAGMVSSCGTNKNQATEFYDNIEKNSKSESK